MIGSGIPSIQSSAPLPKPMFISLGYSSINKMMRPIGIPSSHKIIGIIFSPPGALDVTSDEAGLPAWLVPL